MNIGIPKESRPSEYRVGLTPAGAHALTGRGHTVFIEHDAGLGSGFTDEDYEEAGAKVVYSAHEAFGRADLVLKIARPLESEIELLQEGSAVTGFLHLASAKQAKIDLLLEKRVSAIAYEQLVRPDGVRPVMRPMSELGGRLAVQIAASLMQNNHGGKGILLGGLPGVPPAEVVVLGGGTVGRAAVGALKCLGAHLTVLDIYPDALQEMHEAFPDVVTMYASKRNIQRTCEYADVIIACAATPGEVAPKLITREHLRCMKPRSLILDVAIDQGGNLETSRPTAHDNPVFIEEGVLHYCVPNLSSVLARTASHAFSVAARPYILEIAENGLDSAIEANPEIANAINTHDGQIVNLSRLTVNGDA